MSALTLLANVSTVAAVAFAEKERQAIRQQAQIRLAAADFGQLDLVLEPFDGDSEHRRAIPVSAPPSLDFRFHAVDAAAPREMGRVYGGDDLHRSGRIVAGTVLRERVEVRSGPALLEITGRGDDGPPSVIQLQRLPGYADALVRGATEVHIPVPTCQASRADMG